MRIESKGIRNRISRNSFCVIEGFNMKLVKFVLIALILLGSSGYADVSSDVRRIATYLAIARANHADLLYPQQFNAFQNRFQALSQLNEQEQPSKTAPLLAEIQNWVRATEETELFFSQTLKVRQATLLLGGEDFAIDIFQKAETQRLDAIQLYHNFRIAEAQESALKAEKLYQEAAFYTVENLLLGQIKILIQESIDLGAEKFLPHSLAETRELLDSVERMLRSKRDKNFTFAETSRNLLHKAERLKYLSRLSSQVYQTENGLEMLLLTLEEGFGSLDGESELKVRKAPDSYEEWFNHIKARSELREAENQIIRNRLRTLESTNAEMEEELLSYQSRSERQLYLENKVSRVKEIFENELEWSGEFITIQLDSVRFDDGFATLNTFTQRRLSALADAINEFPNALTIIQYIDYANDSQSYHNLLADQRAKSIDHYLRQHLMIDHSSLYVSGFANQAPATMRNPSAKIEVMINLDAYLKAMVEQNRLKIIDLPQTTDNSFVFPHEICIIAHGVENSSAIRPSNTRLESPGATVPCLSPL